MSQWSSLVLDKQLDFGASWTNSGHTLSVCYVVLIKFTLRSARMFCMLFKFFQAMLNAELYLYSLLVLIPRPMSSFLLL